MLEHHLTTGRKVLETAWEGTPEAYGEADEGVVRRFSSVESRKVPGFTHLLECRRSIPPVGHAGHGDIGPDYGTACFTPEYLGTASGKGWRHGSKCRECKGRVLCARTRLAIRETIPQLGFRESAVACDGMSLGLVVVMMCVPLPKT